MATKFLVTGLPRSRTAWLACLLNHEKCWCEHELTAIDPNLELLSEIEDGDFDAVGTCDSGALLVQPTEFWSGYKVVVVHRSLSEVALALNKKFRGLTLEIMKPLHAIKGRLRSIPHALHVECGSLDNYDTCNMIWKHIGNKDELPPDRFLFYRQFNIQRVDKGRPACVESARRVGDTLNGS